MRRNIEHFCTRYENLLIYGDFNLNGSNDSLQDLVHDLNLENIAKEPTCFKSVNPTCVDLILRSDSGNSQILDNRNWAIGFSCYGSHGT